jgi:hypothetical protein
MFVSCNGKAPDTTPAEPPSPNFVGRVWIATDASAAPGTLRIFLGGGTLVMDSCGETYRLAEWRALDPRHLEWQEDGQAVTAEIADSGPSTLRLELHLRSGRRVENYRLADVPFVCPDRQK